MVVRASKYSIRKATPTDRKGWVDAKKHKPTVLLHFELLMIMDDEGRQQQAWWDGTQWCYHPKRVKGKIIKWRFLQSTERCMND